MRSGSVDRLDGRARCDRELLSLPAPAIGLRSTRWKDCDREDRRDLTEGSARNSGPYGIRTRIANQVGAHLWLDERENGMCLAFGGRCFSSYEELGDLSRGAVFLQSAHAVDRKKSPASGPRSSIVGCGRCSGRRMTTNSSPLMSRVGTTRSIQMIMRRSLAFGPAVRHPSCGSNGLDSRRHTGCGAADDPRGGQRRSRGDHPAPGAGEGQFRAC